MMRMFSPLYVYTTTSNRPIAPMPSVTNRCSPGSESSSAMVMAKESNRNRFGHANTVFAVVDPGFARLVPFDAHASSVRTYCAYVNSVAVGVRIPI
jgi:hypothetical protein